uniref:Uncharacterized protein n=1 Tax=Arundo donax TaxID=35708 RepID=A0A0A9BIB3_ARUDO
MNRTLVVDDWTTQNHGHKIKSAQGPQQPSATQFSIPKGWHTASIVKKRNKIGPACKVNSGDPKEKDTVCSKDNS